jgi:hypothetical protein
MSDQERDKHVKATDEDGGDEVEAHKHGHRDADSTNDDDNDVEAHKHGHRDADSTNDDDGDDVEAHKMSGRS